MSRAPHPLRPSADASVPRRNAERHTDPMNVQHQQRSSSNSIHNRANCRENGSRRSEDAQFDNTGLVESEVHTERRQSPGSVPSTVAAVLNEVVASAPSPSSEGGADRSVRPSAHATSRGARTTAPPNATSFSVPADDGRTVAHRNSPASRDSPQPMSNSTRRPVLHLSNQNAHILVLSDGVNTDSFEPQDPMLSAQNSNPGGGGRVNWNPHIPFDPNASNASVDSVAVRREVRNVRIAGLVQELHDFDEMVTESGVPHDRVALNGILDRINLRMFNERASNTSTELCDSLIREVDEEEKVVLTCQYVEHRFGECVAGRHLPSEKDGIPELPTLPPLGKGGQIHKPVEKSTTQPPQEKRNGAQNGHAQHQKQQNGYKAEEVTHRENTPTPAVEQQRRSSDVPIGTDGTRSRSSGVISGAAPSASSFEKENGSEDQSACVPRDPSKLQESRRPLSALPLSLNNRNCAEREQLTSSVFKGRKEHKQSAQSARTSERSSRPVLAPIPHSAPSIMLQTGQSVRHGSEGSGTHAVASAAVAEEPRVRQAKEHSGKEGSMKLVSSKLIHASGSRAENDWSSVASQWQKNTRQGELLQTIRAPPSESVMSESTVVVEDMHDNSCESSPQRHSERSECTCTSSGGERMTPLSRDRSPLGSSPGSPPASATTPRALKSTLELRGCRKKMRMKERALRKELRRLRRRRKEHRYFSDECSSNSCSSGSQSSDEYYAHGCTACARDPIYPCSRHCEVIPPDDETIHTARGRVKDWVLNICYETKPIIPPRPWRFGPKADYKKVPVPRASYVSPVKLAFQHHKLKSSVGAADATTTAASTGAEDPHVVLEYGVKTDSLRGIPLLNRIACDRVEEMTDQPAKRIVQRYGKMYGSARRDSKAYLKGDRTANGYRYNPYIPVDSRLPASVTPMRSQADAVAWNFLDEELKTAETEYKQYRTRCVRNLKRQRDLLKEIENLRQRLALQVDLQEVLHSLHDIVEDIQFVQQDIDLEKFAKLIPYLERKKKFYEHRLVTCDHKNRSLLEHYMQLTKEPELDLFFTARDFPKPERIRLVPAAPNTTVVDSTPEATRIPPKKRVSVHKRDIDTSMIDYTATATATATTTTTATQRDHSSERSEVEVLSSVELANETRLTMDSECRELATDDEVPGGVANVLLFDELACDDAANVNVSESTCRPIEVTEEVANGKGGGGGEVASRAEEVSSSREGETAATPQRSMHEESPEDAESDYGDEANESEAGDRDEDDRTSEVSDGRGGGFCVVPVLDLSSVLLHTPGATEAAATEELAHSEEDDEAERAPVAAKPPLAPGAPAVTPRLAGIIRRTQAHAKSNPSTAGGPSSSSSSSPSLQTTSADSSRTAPRTTNPSVSRKFCVASHNLPEKEEEGSENTPAQMKEKGEESMGPSGGEEMNTQRDEVGGDANESPERSQSNRNPPTRATSSVPSTHRGDSTAHAPNTRRTEQSDIDHVLQDKETAATDVRVTPAAQNECATPLTPQPQKAKDQRAKRHAKKDAANQRRLNLEWSALFSCNAHVPESPNLQRENPLGRDFCVSAVVAAAVVDDFRRLNGEVVNNSNNHGEADKPHEAPQNLG